MSTTPHEPTVPPTDPNDNPDTREAAPATPPSGGDGDDIPPHVQAVLIAFDPSCDCPDMLEKLAEYVADLDVFAESAVHLLDKVPRTEGPAKERALKRVGRMVERIAQTAWAAGEYAEYAVEHVRGRDPEAIDENAPLVTDDDDDDDDTEGK